MSWDTLRLAHLSLPAKILVTLFLLLVGPGFLAATANIYLQHQDADLEPGLSVDDLRRQFHGLEKTVTPEAKTLVKSVMLEQVRPGGDMREHLEPGGEAEIRALISWLEAGTKRPISPPRDACRPATRRPAKSSRIDVSSATTPTEVIKRTHPMRPQPMQRRSSRWWRK